MTELTVKPFDAPSINNKELLAKLKDTFPRPVEDVNLPMGIEETVDVVDFGVSFANAIIASYEDGKLSLGDFQYAIKPIMKAPAAFNGISQVPAELADLDEVERDAIIQRVKENLEVSSEKAMRIVEKALTWAYATYDLVDEIITE